MYMNTQDAEHTNANVVIIPATRPCPAETKMRHRGKLRVAAYCRVSTGDESQQSSYTMQKSFYTDMIKARKGWKLAGIYADEAISGTSRAKRREFNRMIEDAMSGKFDYIITKSISRFARNTVDTLGCVRQLRQQDPPIGIFFEKENIDTLDAAGELILTILSALAQDESRSISENIRWTFQKNFQNGKPQINLNRMLGYDKSKNGEWIINCEQAEIVRYIFNSFARGKTANCIARSLNLQGRTTVQGNRWRADSVFTILRNEKYVGDLEMQKTITESFLTHRSVENRGEAPKYYVREHHTPIVERATWDRVQEMLKEQSIRTDGRRGSAPPVFGNIFGMGENGRKVLFSRMMYKRTAVGYRDERSDRREAGKDKGYKEIYSYSYPVWRSRSGKERVTICECALEQSFMEMLYKIKAEPAELTERFNTLYANICRADSEKPMYNRAKIIKMQIRELEDMAEEVTDEAMAENINYKLGELKKELSLVDGGKYSAEEMKRSFGLFMKYVEELPNRNVFGIAKPEKGMPYDYLAFDKLIYMRFITKGFVNGDEVRFFTSFGMEIKSTGNMRRLEDFIGFAKRNDKDEREVIEKLWQINDNAIQYRRKYE